MYCRKGERQKYLRETDLENKTLRERRGWDGEQYKRRQLSKEERWRWQSETDGESDGQSCGISCSGRECLRWKLGGERGEPGREGGQSEVEVHEWVSLPDKRLPFCSTWQTCFSSAWLSPTLLSLWLITLVYHHTSAGRHMLHDNYVHWQTHCVITVQTWTGMHVSVEAAMNCIHQSIRK